MTPYKTLRFRAGEIPAGLLKDHRLKDGVHGRLRVLRGQVVFVEGASRVTLTEGTQHRISSKVHHLEEVDGAHIEIDFYRDA